MMKEVSRRIDATPAAIWEVLADGWLYTGWVVGTSRIRSVDAAWPQVGTRLHHSVGSWPVQIDDHTTVLDSEPQRRLVLQARGWPAGEARIELTLAAAGAQTTVRMGEEATDGPGKWFDNPLQRKILVARNRESLERLSALAVGRAARGFTS